MTQSNVTVDPKLFKAYDIRGIYGENLTDEVAYRIGRAAAQYLNVPEIAVGRDMRVSSPQLAAALMRGITDKGVNAIELGMTTTDGLYFAVGKFNYPAGVMITASHNPGRVQRHEILPRPGFSRQPGNAAWPISATSPSAAISPNLPPKARSSSAT